MRSDTGVNRTRKTGGGKGIRTPGLLIANETLYQLSYTPDVRTLSEMRGSHYGTKRKSGK